MTGRPATRDDLAAITALYRAEDVVWFGAPEHDEAEVREELDRVADLATQSLLVHDGDDLIGAAWWWGHETTLLAASSPHRAEVITQLLAAAVAAGQRDAYALARDVDVITAIEALGWVHTHSSFDLLRPVSDEWTLPEPAWPFGVLASPAGDDELRAIHTLVYDDAGWAEVDGHVRRDFDEWRALFVSGPDSDRDVLVARRDGRPVGVALSRTFSDGTGWIAQLAVATNERGHGLGRALLLAALRGRRDAGATQLGLGVQAANATALTLYESVGLRIEREFRSFEPAAAFG